MSKDQNQPHDDLCQLRARLVHARRDFATAQDLAGVTETQRQIELLDEAIEDEHRIFSKDHRPFMAFI